MLEVTVRRDADSATWEIADGAFGPAGAALLRLDDVIIYVDIADPTRLPMVTVELPDLDSAARCSNRSLEIVEALYGQNVVDILRREPPEAADGVRAAVADGHEMRRLAAARLALVDDVRPDPPDDLVSDLEPTVWSIEALVAARLLGVAEERVAAEANAARSALDDLEAVRIVWPVGGRRVLDAAHAILDSLDARPGALTDDEIERAWGEIVKHAQAGVHHTPPKVPTFRGPEREVKSSWADELRAGVVDSSALRNVAIDQASYQTVGDEIRVDVRLAEHQSAPRIWARSSRVEDGRVIASAPCTAGAAVGELTATLPGPESGASVVIDLVLLPDAVTASHALRRHRRAEQTGRLAAIAERRAAALEDDGHWVSSARLWETAAAEWLEVGSSERVATALARAARCYNLARRHQDRARVFALAGEYVPHLDSRAVVAFDPLLGDRVLATAKRLIDSLLELEQAADNGSAVDVVRVTNLGRAFAAMDLGALQGRAYLLAARARTQTSDADDFAALSLVQGARVLLYAAGDAQRAREAQDLVETLLRRTGPR